MELICCSLIFATTFIVVVALYFRNEERSRRADFRRASLGEVLPNRLQAYERLSLYLDRITPETMAVREQYNFDSAKDLHIALLNSVRMEFDHNAAMQIYVGEASWKRILRAKKEVIKSLTETMKGVVPTATPMEYAADLIEHSRNNSLFYVERAKEGLRKDIEGNFVNS